MERMTYEQEVMGNRCWQIKGADNSLCKEVCDEHEDHNGCSGCPIGKAIDRLAEYENLGKSPEEIAGLLPPCRIGDEVWCIRWYHDKLVPQCGKVSEISYTKDMSIIIKVKYVGLGSWGEKIFATESEALEAIAKRRSERKNWL